MTSRLTSALYKSPFIRKAARTRLGKMARQRAQALKIWRVRMKPAHRAHDARQAQILTTYNAKPHGSAALVSPATTP